MSVTVERLPGEPILIVVIKGELTVDEVKEAYRLSQPFLEEIDGPVWRVTDVSKVSTSLPDMLKILSQAGQRSQGSSSDPRVHVTLVGTTTWMNFFRDALSSDRFGGAQIACFENMDDALESVRFDIGRVG